MVVLIVLFLALYLVHLGLDEVSNPRLRTQSLSHATSSRYDVDRASGGGPELRRLTSRVRS